MVALKGSIMQNKKLILTLGALLIFVGAASFLAGRLLNRGVVPLDLFGPEDDGVSILGAEELPKTPPEVEGLLVERRDNIIFVQASQPNEDPGGAEVGSPEDVGGGPKMEVVVSTETTIYRDTTETPDERPSGNDPRVLQQTVAKGMLEELIASQTYIMVWGRKSGDRVVADVLVYSYLTNMRKP